MNQAAPIVLLNMFYYFSDGGRERKKEINKTHTSYCKEKGVTIGGR